MDIGFDPSSMLVGLAALGLAVRESRRNGSAIVQRLEAQASGGMNVAKNGGEYYSSFNLKIRNLGISLHDVSACLIFESEDGLCTFELPPVGPIKAEFSKGMIAEFCYESFAWPIWGPKMLSQLTDPVRQRARVVVKTQGLVAKEFLASIAEVDYTVEIDL